MSESSTQPHSESDERDTRIRDRVTAHESYGEIVFQRESEMARQWRQRMEEEAFERGQADMGKRILLHVLSLRLDRFLAELNRWVDPQEQRNGKFARPAASEPPHPDPAPRFALPEGEGSTGG